MRTTTRPSRSFGDLCVACLVVAIVLASVVSLGVVVWVALL
jgi:hypothetical protein